MFLWIAYLSAASVLIPMYMGFKRFDRIQLSLTPVFYLLFISGSIDLAGIVLNGLKINNMFLAYIYTAVEFVFIVTAYQYFLNLSRSLILVLIVILLTCVALEAVVKEVTAYNSISSGLECLILISLSLFCFYRMMLVAETEPNPLKQPWFYFNCAVMIYFGGVLILFLSSSIIQKNYHEKFAQLYTIHSLLHVFYYLVLTKALVQKPERKNAFSFVACEN